MKDTKISDWKRKYETKIKIIVFNPEGLDNEIDAMQKVLSGAGLIQGRPVIVRSCKDMEQLYGIEHNIDLLLIVGRNSSILLKEWPIFLKLKIPVIFWETNAVTNMFAWRYVSFLKAHGIEAEAISNNKQFSLLVKSYGLRSYLAKVKILVYGDIMRSGMVWASPYIIEKARENLGLRFQIAPMDEIINKIKTISTEAAKKKLEEWSRHDLIRIAGTSATALSATKVYLALKAVLEEEHAQGVTMACLPELRLRYPQFMPCLALAMLQEEGIVSACDAEGPGIATMTLFSAFLNRACVMSNFYPSMRKEDIEKHFHRLLGPARKNIAYYTHCSEVAMMPPRVTEPGRIVLREFDFFGAPGKGITVAGKLKPGQKIILGRLNNSFDRIILTAGKIVENKTYKGIRGCNTAAVLDIPALEKIIQAPMDEHMVLVYGDEIEDLKFAGEKLRLEVEVL